MHARVAICFTMLHFFAADGFESPNVRLLAVLCTSSPYNRKQLSFFQSFHGRNPRVWSPFNFTLSSLNGTILGWRYIKYWIKWKSGMTNRFVLLNLVKVCQRFEEVCVIEKKIINAMLTMKCKEWVERFPIGVHFFRINEKFNFL